MRLSIGATRGRLVRQLLTESLVLSVLGGALGIARRLLGRQLLPVCRQTFAARLARACVRGGAQHVTGLVFGIAPALRRRRRRRTAR